MGGGLTRPESEKNRRNRQKRLLSSRKSAFAPITARTNGNQKGSADKNFLFAQLRWMLNSRFHKSLQN
jgi:hypothetical protein